MKALVILGIAAVLGLIGWAVWYEWRYPCLQTREYQATCGGGLYCAGYDSKSNCILWLRHPEYQCTQTECVKRGDRHAMQAEQEIKQAMDTIKGLQ